MIRTRQDLADYCLRTLGAGIVNIEITDEQVADRIEEAMKFAHEYYFDAIERDYLVHRITGTTLVLNNVDTIKVNDPILSAKGTISSIYSVDQSTNSVVITHQIGYDKFVDGDTLTIGGNPYTVSSITLGDIDNGWITAAENIVGVKKILNITSILGSSDYIFNVQYQVMMSEIQNLTKGTVSYF